MKQNIFIAALLAGMLALAGCGGGSSSTTSDDDTTTTAAETTETAAETISEAIAACETVDCVTAIKDGLASNDDLTDEEKKNSLGEDADDKIAAIAAAAVGWK